MKYPEIRPNIQSGDLLAFTHKEWLSIYDLQVQAVRIFTESEYSHVAIAWVVGGRVFVLESVEPKVRIFPLSKLTPFYWIPTDHGLSQEAEEFALSHVGEPYSKLECIKAYFQPLDDNGKWECAKYVHAVMSKNGIDLGDKLTPAAIVESAEKLGFPVYLVQP